MGYRVRLGRFPKVAHKKYAQFKSEQEAQEWFEEHDSSSAPYRPAEHQELVELGKYVDYKDDRFNIVPFYDFDLDENDFVIVDRDFLLHIIEEYRANTVKWYQELDEAISAGDVNQVHHHVKNKVSEWESRYYDNLKLDDHEGGDEDGRLTRSWKYEYAVFNLLFILHTFDWDNDYLIYSGW